MTILETIPILQRPGAYLIYVFAGLITAVICFLISAAFERDDCNTGTAIFFIFTTLAFCVTIFGIVKTITEPMQDTGRVKYIVKVDDTISMNEFYNNYKILEHARYSDIYTVEEIKNESSN